MAAQTIPLEILIPVYREGAPFVKILDLLGARVKTPFRALICYDDDNDETITAIKYYRAPFEIVTVKNDGKGVHGAIMSGFKASRASAVIVYPADDDANAGIIDRLYEKFKEGCDIVAPSRFMKGGCMVGCRWTKAYLVRAAAFVLYYLAGLPTHDPTNGFRLFSRRVIDQVAVQSDSGFAYSIELLVKCHRLGWKISEVPSQWFERKQGKSRFKIFKWMPVYLRWFTFAFVTRLRTAFWATWFLAVLVLYLVWVIGPKLAGKI